MPTQEDYLAILQYLDEIPEVNNKEDPLCRIWGRYNVDPDLLRPMCESFAEKTLQQFTGFLKDSEFRSKVLDEVEDLKRMQDRGAEDYEIEFEFLEKAIASAVLQMFVFAGEYSRRWVLPDLMALANADIEEMTSNATT